MKRRFVWGLCALFILLALIPFFLKKNFQTIRGDCMSKKYKVLLAVGLCCLSLTGCTSAYEAYEEGYKDALHDAEDYVQEEIVMFYEGLLDECYEQVPASRKFLKNIDYYMDVDFDWPCENPYESRNE